LCEAINVILHFTEWPYSFIRNLKNSQETFDSKDEIELEIKITVEFSPAAACYVFKFPALNFKDFLPAFHPASWLDTALRLGENKFLDVHWVDGENLQGKMCKPFDGLYINRRKRVNRNCNLYVTYDANGKHFSDSSQYFFFCNDENIVHSHRHNTQITVRVKNLLPALFIFVHMRFVEIIEYMKKWYDFTWFHDTGLWNHVAMNVPNFVVMLHFHSMAPLACVYFTTAVNYTVLFACDTIYDARNIKRFFHVRFFCAPRHNFTVIFRYSFLLLKHYQKNSMSEFIFYFIIYILFYYFLNCIAWILFQALSHWN